MFPDTLIAALHNYLQTEWSWARHGFYCADPDQDLGGSDAARQELLKQLDAPYPAGGEPLVAAIREFIYARGAFAQCDDFDDTLDEASERLDAARQNLLAQLRSFDPVRRACDAPRPNDPRVRNAVLAAIDDDDQAEQAVRVAGALAQKLGSAVVVAHVIEPVLRLGYDPLDTERRQAARRRAAAKLLERGEKWLPAGVPVQRMVREGVAASQIVAGAREIGATLIVLGMRSRGRLIKFLLGSASKTVKRDAECPVLTVGSESDSMSVGPVGRYRKAGSRRSLRASAGDAASEKAEHCIAPN
jgi:nucleotide-binding universal stress UspA family protein